MLKCKCIINFFEEWKCNIHSTGLFFCEIITTCSNFSEFQKLFISIFMIINLTMHYFIIKTWNSKNPNNKVQRCRLRSEIPTTWLEISWKIFLRPRRKKLIGSHRPATSFCENKCNFILYSSKIKILMTVFTACFASRSAGTRHAVPPVDRP